ncbi:Epoxide hydrolase N terminus [Tessaracoccus bendigoensis DSM 12906]|uniref:Epoxide hydrolase N terminus n=1 Tax=Tessaracoccus bendigoensis DSM 12906 TaxID=1123357 RepID=A0A1M6BJV1_9ACTN|nr:alpha/beta fold hydrolase [Tessaracoccus bendigoensis]SHI49060.1 Epoxide hydrolase N terminus [Tessaracoccus bendigoensis DSM 12906]
MNTATTPSTELPRVSQEALDALDARVTAVQLPRIVPAAAQAPGHDQSRQRSLLERWRGGFDWREVEDRIAGLGYVETRSDDGRRIAAIRARAEAPTGAPILLIHGWPDSPLRFIDLIPLLTAAGHDVVAPAIAGFWLSDEPEGEMSRDIPAADFHALMQALGYERYAVHAGDWGSAVAQTIAQQHPEGIIALHLTDVPFDLAYTIDKATAGPAEAAYLESIEKFGDEALYLTANTMQPNMVATVLADTPFGLATWLGSLYDAWSESRIADDHVIANAALMHLTSTVRSAMRLYSEPAMSWEAGDDAGWADADWGDAEAGGEGSWEQAADVAGPGDAEAADWGDAAGWAPAAVTVPTAFALFPTDLATAPRELAERFFAVERFTIMPRGGHFAALEEPGLVAEDLLQFLAGLGHSEP